MDQPDQHTQEREAEKTVDLESLADALGAFRQLHRDLDQWERVHLALALTPEIERMPKVKPTCAREPIIQV